MRWESVSGTSLIRLIFLVLEEVGQVVGARQTIHWNSTNPTLRRGDYAVQVHINDYLDVFCPHYPDSVPETQTESFALYLVSFEGYQGCFETPGAVKRWECNRPHAPFGPVRFSEKIQLYTPFSLGFEFRQGQDYYYISLPLEDSPTASPCLRLRLSVCCETTAGSQVEVPAGTTAPQSGVSSLLQSPETLLALSLLSVCVSLLLPLPLRD
ncbi:ephrin-A5-like [Acipenser ruthenus]|uniref:ephrin-A5-like n=1 Tax=Acipenser ruthenus TaxID=7906 RepID=UPI0027423B3A|nr:ephrin-A5-like [Acipenser ruthenus]